MPPLNMRHIVAKAMCWVHISTTTYVWLKIPLFLLSSFNGLAMDFGSQDMVESP